MEKLNNLLEKIQQQQPDFSFDRNKIEEEIESKSTIFSHIGIKLLSVIGGILGSGFFLGFLASIVFNSSKGCIIFGSLFIIGSVVIHKISQSILLDTGIICLYLVGGLLLGYGLNSEHIGDNGTGIYRIGDFHNCSIFLSRFYARVFVAAYRQ